MVSNSKRKGSGLSGSYLRKKADESDTYHFLNHVQMRGIYLIRKYSAHGEGQRES